MNLLCPNCQKMLTVPDEFAGQTMKCPMCEGAFSVPSLPGVTAPPPSAPEPDIYSLRSEAPPPSPPPQSISSLQPPTPADLSAVPAPPPSAPSIPTPQPPRPSPGQPRVLSLEINPTVLPWIAPVCLLVVFFLQFFTWLGLYPGGVASVTQNAWQAAFGSYSMDPNLPHAALNAEDKDKDAKPRVSVLTLFYLLLFFPILAVTIASVVLPLVPVKLPPAVERIWPWRWGIVAAANLLLFFFLLLQLLLGFDLESRYADWVDKRVKVETKEPKNLPQQMREDSERGKYLQDLNRTIWLKFAVFLHLLAILGAALIYWIDRRGTARPLPQLVLRW